jgi:hypothetical protein
MMIMLKKNLKKLELKNKINLMKNNNLNKNQKKLDLNKKNNLMNNLKNKNLMNNN